MHRLSQQIASLQQKLVLRQRAAAACLSLSTVLASVIVLGAIDYVVRYADRGLRIMASFGLAAITVWAIYHWWYLPTRRRLTPLAVARRVERRFPQLGDSLASAMDFLQQAEGNETAGSPQLRRIVVAEAHSAIDRLPLDQVIDNRPLRRAALWLAVPAGVLALCLSYNANAVKTAMWRLAAPLSATEWPRTHYLAFRKAPQRIAAGQTFEVELVDTTGTLPSDVRIEYSTADAGQLETTSEAMTRAGNVMIARRINVRHSFAFRAVGGDDRSMPWQFVEVIELPRLEEFSLVAHPPAYTGLPPRSVDRHLEVLAGTGLEVQGTANEPLKAVQIWMDDSLPIAASIHADAAGHERQAFYIDAGQWIPNKSGPYRVDLANAAGIAGVAGEWNLRVQPDPPPIVDWRLPNGDLYIVATAVVPFEIVVRDNLAIQRVDLAFNRISESESDEAKESAEARIELFRASEAPAIDLCKPIGTNGETRTVEYKWELASLALPIGARISCHAEAADYRPTTSRTTTPLRITIISNEELNARIADQHALIVQQLERLLASQSVTREELRRFEKQTHNGIGRNSGDRIAIQGAELEQRQIAEKLCDPGRGVPALAYALLSDIAMNRISGVELCASMERLLAELSQLRSGPLSAAESRLVAARKTVEGVAARKQSANDREPTPLSNDDLQQLNDLLTAAGTAQDEVIIGIGRLVNELAGSTDYYRVTQQLAEICQDQITHEESARDDIGLTTLPLQMRELSRKQRDLLNRAAASQSAIATRFDKVLQSIDRLAHELLAKDADAAKKAAHAADLARRLAVAASMQETSRDFNENRVGQALAREGQIASNLQDVLDALKINSELKPDQLVDQMRTAEARLASLREKLSAHRQQLSQSENEGAATASSQQLGQLSNVQQVLYSEIDGLSRKLNQLQATDAGQSTQSAVQRLTRASDGAGARADSSPRPAPSSEVQKAEQDLEVAARQLAERRRRAEENLALELVRRFQSELASLVERQMKVVQDTIELDAAQIANKTVSEADVLQLTRLTAEERALAQIASEHSELLFGLGAVRISLENVERRLDAAAAMLERHDTGPRTQQIERHALKTLEGMLQAFAQTATEVDSAPSAALSPNQPDGEHPQRRPTFELLEVKVLRILQVDLNERTQAYREKMARSQQPLQELERKEALIDSHELLADQRRLTELVEQMLTRDDQNRE